MTTQEHAVEVGYAICADGTWTEREQTCLEFVIEKEKKLSGYPLQAASKVNMLNASLENLKAKVQYDEQIWMERGQDLFENLKSQSQAMGDKYPDITHILTNTGALLGNIKHLRRDTMEELIEFIKISMDVQDNRAEQVIMLQKFFFWSITKKENEEKRANKNRIMGNQALSSQTDRTFTIADEL